MGDEFIPSWSLLFYTSEWLIRLVMLGLVIDRHPPRVAMTWLLVIFFLPWPGLLLYLFIGENRLPHRRLVQRKALQARLESVHGQYMPHRENVSSRVDQSLLPTVMLAERLGYMPIMCGNEATLLADTDTVIDVLIEDIDAAQHHVHLLVYIFAADATGQRVVAALERAVLRGVECRLLADAQGSRKFLKRCQGDWPGQVLNAIQHCRPVCCVPGFRVSTCAIIARFSLLTVVSPIPDHKILLTPVMGTGI